jgi:hypothetical protein
MPRFDGTGPERKGVQTGRGLGKCKPNQENNTQDDAQKSPELKEQAPMQGRGRRMGSGKGLGHSRGRL